tara:strand:- start:270 stop:656 length:387 start_codon:yes stop_codon:yes gene_type:complete
MKTTEIDTITKLEKNGYIGTDACLAISLFEYGLAWKEDDKQIEFIYGISVEGTEYNRFDRCTFDLDIKAEEEFDWADFDEVASFSGLTVEQFRALPLSSQIYNLQVHYGFENVFGSSYWEGFEIQEHE